MMDKRVMAEDIRQCNICGRMRRRGQYLISLTNGEVRCSDATDCFIEMERLMVSGTERHLVCNRCRQYAPLREIRMVLPIGNMQCIDMGRCKLRRERSEVSISGE